MRKALVLLLAAGVLLTGTALPAIAAPDVFFAAVDFEILPLSDETMPIRSGGTVYAPPAVFTAQNSVFFSWVSDNGRRVFLIDKGNRILTFDLDAGIAYDWDKQYNYKALRQNGEYYLPVDKVCEHFGITWTELETDYGPMLRLRIASTPASDQSFQNSNATKTYVKTYYNEYTTVKPAPTLASSLQTSSPTEPPSPSPREVAYLTIDDGPSALTERFLDVLDEYGVHVTFFMPGYVMRSEQAAESMRRILGSGHAIGIHSYSHDAKLFYASPEAMLDELKRTNDLLERHTMYRTRLVRTPYGSVPYMSPTLCQAMTDGGYRFWDWNIDGDPTNTRPTAAQIVDGVISDLERHSFAGPPVILIHEREKTLEALPKILDYMISQKYIFVVCTENERPFNYKKWTQ